ncbi:low temperature requirement protein A [Actinocorallia populi]|uniref:low temperature requirement protein A n=1 Tax=Actinocorallia populi TaxID=2079200 RepID=UPI000D7CEE0E|nr:low temperature requirement protein A [Actinocorallia populi]
MRRKVFKVFDSGACCHKRRSRPVSSAERTDRRALAAPWRAPTTWHPHHIAERYGLSIIILFGESGLTNAATAHT